MRISELMSHAELWIWPAMALGIFVTVFVLIVARAIRQPADEVKRIARLPVED